MTVALWIINILLAVAFLGAGAMKVAKKPEQLKESGMQWVEDVSPGLVKFIGVAEVLGAIGLILPLAVDVLPVLTPVAAALLTVTMIGAVVTHLRRSESPAAPLVLGILTAVSTVLGFIAI